jgi:hypothetical protein
MSNQVMNKLYAETLKSNHFQKHAAVITKNSKKVVSISHNSSRSKFHISSQSVLNCSMHAELGALKKLIKCKLKPRKGGYCVLRRP